MGLGQRNYTYNNTLCEDIYIVENPDILQSSESVGSTPLLTLSDNNEAVARYSKIKKGAVVVMSIPFETIRGQQQKDALMQEIISLLNQR
jgi:phage head maturation protease